MINVKFGDVSVSVAENSSVYEAANAAGLISREVLSAGINGATVDLTTPLAEDCEVTLYTFDAIEGKKTFWHTASHILAQAVKRLYPR